MAAAADAAPVSDYIRVKRKRTTIFLYTDPTDTIHDLRAKINLITKVPVTDIKFFQDPHGEVAVDEQKSLADQRIASDDELFMIYRKEGSDEWEEIDIAAQDGAPKEAGS